MTLTLQGTGFTTSNDVKVSIQGNIDCEITSVTTTEVVCSFDPIPVGNYDVRVFVDSMGEAVGSLSMAVTLTVTSISPTSGAIGGGTKLTISGYGFPGSSNTNSSEALILLSVTINGEECQITSDTSTSIECITPGATAGTLSLIHI